MNAKLIVYDLSGLDQYRKVLVNRALFGFNDHSNKGNYMYKRPGVLKDIQHLRLVKGVLIIKSDGEKKVIDVLKKHKAKHFVFTVGIKGLH